MRLQDTEMGGYDARSSFFFFFFFFRSHSYPAF
jgi:hypothetical protein